MRTFAVVAAVVLAVAGCSGARLVSGSSWSPGTGGDPGLMTSPGTGGDLGPMTSPGTGGISGTGGSNVTLCGQLATEYAAVLNAAKGCTVGAPDQCRAVVSLDPRNCSDLAYTGQTYVNDGTIVEAARQKWLAACDTSDDLDCQPSAPASTSIPPSTCVQTMQAPLVGECLPSVPDSGVVDLADAGAGQSCDQLADDYAAVVNAARACTPGAPNQCQTYAGITVPPPNFCCPNGQVPVNDENAVILAQIWWGPQCASPCAGGLCFGPGTPAVCVPVAGGPPPGGICVPTTARDAGAPQPLPSRCPGGNCDAGAFRPFPPRCPGPNCDAGALPARCPDGSCPEIARDAGAP
jgi:hypothetical protein